MLSAKRDLSGAPEFRPMDYSHLFRGLSFKVANGASTQAALDLRRAVYERDWPEVTVDKLIDDRDKTACHLIAVAEEAKVVASLRIVTPEHRPFDMEEFISLDGIFPPGARPAEIGRLCVCHESRPLRLGSFVHLGLLKLAVELAPELNITDLVLTAIPQLHEFYKRGLFVDVGVTFEHPTWGHVDVMRLNVATLIEAGNRGVNSIARVLVADGLPNFAR